MEDGLNITPLPPRLKFESENDAHLQMNYNFYNSHNSSVISTFYKKQFVKI